jgi:hypothetical protein
MGQAAEVHGIHGAVSLGTAWFMGLLPRHARISTANRRMVWTLVPTSLFEVA